MRTCSKCGSYLPEGRMFCQACGRLCVHVPNKERDADKSILRDAASRNNGMNFEKTDRKEAPRITTTEMSQRIIFAAAYFGIFFFVPLIAMPFSKEAKFHANQGLVLFLFGLLLSGIAAGTAAVLGEVFTVLSIFHPLLMVYGAANAIQGKHVELPVIGRLRILKDDSNFGGF